MCILDLYYNEDKKKRWENSKGDVVSKMVTDRRVLNSVPGWQEEAKKQQPAAIIIVADIYFRLKWDGKKSMSSPQGKGRSIYGAIG